VREKMKKMSLGKVMGEEIDQSIISEVMLGESDELE